MERNKYNCSPIYTHYPIFEWKCCEFSKKEYKFEKMYRFVTGPWHGKGNGMTGRWAYISDRTIHDVLKSRPYNPASYNTRYIASQLAYAINNINRISATDRKQDIKDKLKISFKAAIIVEEFFTAIRIPERPSVLPPSPPPKKQP